MMRSERAYRAVIRVYPRKFRREYSDSMTQLFMDRARHEGVGRAWRVAARDTAVSAPRQYKESVMHASPQTKLVVAALATAAGIIATMFIGGSLITIALLFLLAWELAAILRGRGAGITTHRWWTFTAAGVGVFMFIIVFFAVLPWPEDWREMVPGELAWATVMFGLATSIVLVVVGLFVGVAQWAARRHANTTPA
ncbi:MAG: hypothetical protein ABW211_03435 [Acidimicrobiia bacterium]